MLLILTKTFFFPYKTSYLNEEVLSLPFSKGSLALSKRIHSEEGYTLPSNIRLRK